MAVVVAIGMLQVGVVQAVTTSTMSPHHETVSAQCSGGCAHSVTECLEHCVEKSGEQQTQRASLLRFAPGPATLPVSTDFDFAPDGDFQNTAPSIAYRSTDRILTVVKLE